MALYEIRTLITRKRVSLVSYGEFENDLVAILAARTLLRGGEALELWRGEKLVYRFGLPIDRTSPPKPKAMEPKKRQGTQVAGFWISAFKR